MRVFTSLLELSGAALVVAGLALWSPPLALVVAGLVLVVIAASLSAPRETSVGHETGTGRRPRSVA